MGLSCLIWLAAVGTQGVDFFETPEYKRYQQVLSSLKSYEVVGTSFKPGLGGHIWSRKGEKRIRVRDRVYEHTAAGWLVRDLLTGRNHRLEWYEDIPLVELLMLVPLRGEPTNPLPKAFRLTREVPQDGPTVTEVGYRLADTHVDVRTTVDYWFSPLTGLLTEIGWRNEGMTQPNVNSMRLEWTLKPTEPWPQIEIARPTSDYGRYQLLRDSRDSEAYVLVQLPKGVSAELEVRIGDTTITTTSNRLDVKGAPGTVGGVFVAGRGLAVRFQPRYRLVISCGAIKNGGKKERVVAGQKISPGQTVAFFPKEYAVEGRAKPLAVKSDVVTILR